MLFCYNVPKVMKPNTSASVYFKKESIASCLILEDHLKQCYKKQTLQPYKNMKHKFAPKYPHSNLGDFTIVFFIAKKIPLNPLYFIYIFFFFISVVSVPGC